MRYCIICGKEHQSTTDHFKTDHSFLIRNKKFNKDDDKKWFIKFKINVKALSELNYDWNIVLNNEIIAERKNNICKNIIDKNQSYSTVSTIAKEYKFQWSNIHFQDGHIVFEDNKTQMRFSKINCSKSKAVLNNIKEAFYIEKFGKKLCKFFATGNSIKIELSKDIKDILNSIDLIVELYNKKYSPKKGISMPVRKIDFKNFPSESPLIHCTNDKMKYFKFLYAIRNDKRKIVPLQEYFNGSLEDTILFFIKNSSNKEYAIWENANPDRATYIFLITDLTVLNNIKNFIQNESRNKRSALKAFYNHNKARSIYGFYKSFNHKSDFEAYKREISNLKYT
jgi:hypothetical protein